ncbi:MAG: 2-vinyl bacteriochlorophyllide hydratase [Acidibrevibacterium sp.]|uniref:2-vinyl bacteriochlorophyllide hydratase n=1 Tax=Acidibrevibacterium sp. TaxID=2606776 RepID=UPI003D03ADD9
MTNNPFQRWLDAADCCPFGTTAGRGYALEHPRHESAVRRPAPRLLYTPEQRQRRDASAWTIVQGVLAQVQFVVFLASLSLVLRYLGTGQGYGLATASIVVKTGILFAILFTGSLWEHDVFGRYLFAPAFFWEDVVSLLVLALHAAYVVALLTGALDPIGQMLLALAGYAAYVVNATQFLIKFGIARRNQRETAFSSVPR